MLLLLVRGFLLVVALFLFLWSVLVVGWSYPHLGFMALGVAASLGAGICLVAVLRLRHRLSGVGLTLGSAVSLVLLSWSPGAALASLILLLAGVILWVKTLRRPPS